MHWSDFDSGGHFAAMETPQLLVDDIRTFFVNGDVNCGFGVETRAERR